jgi:hypothetical protein
MKGAVRLLAALEGRERANLAELARVGERVASGREVLANLDVFIEELNVRASLDIASILLDAPRTVAEMLEAERHSRSLRQEVVKLAAVRARARVEFDELSQRKRAAADRWQRSSARLQHIRERVRDHAMRVSMRRTDAEEGEYADRRATARSSV